MKKSTQLSDVLHILLHVAQSNGPMTSEHLAKALQTNPVVVRRTMAGLRDRGFVASEKGHGGGWQLSCDLESVTLHDIYTALGTPTMIALGNRTNAPDCLVEKAVNIATNNAFTTAEATLIASFRDTTLADLYKIIDKHPRREHHGSSNKT